MQYILLQFPTILILRNLKQINIYTYMYIHITLLLWPHTKTMFFPQNFTVPNWGHCFNLSIFRKPYCLNCKTIFMRNPGAWPGGSAVKSTYGSSEELELIPRTHTEPLITAYNSSSRGYDTFFWSLLTLDSCVHRHIYTYK